MMMMMMMMMKHICTYGREEHTKLCPDTKRLGQFGLKPEMYKVRGIKRGTQIIAAVFVC
jgi:hypothetical protein